MDARSNGSEGHGQGATRRRLTRRGQPTPFGFGHMKVVAAEIRQQEVRSPRLRRAVPDARSCLPRT